jgi:Peptidase A4 family
VHLHAMSLWAPAVLSVGIFGLVVLQSTPTQTQIYSQKTAVKKSITRQVSTAPKTVQPTAAPQKVASPPLSSPPAAPIKTLVQAGTPKPEPVVTPSPSSSVSGLTPTIPAPSPASSQVPSSQTTTGYMSTNWSGYLATNGSFTGVSGSWTATLATGSGSTTSADSSWIGIGGVTTSDLIQVGTQNVITANGQVSTSAFYEMLPNGSQPVPGVTVSPGDSMTASISEVSSGQWTISITDKTDGQSDTITVSYASSLSSAEWIEEDPSFSFRRQIPFDNFHEAFFTGGLTVSNGSAVNIAASTAQPVTMVNNTDQTVAAPSAIGSDGASFTVTP